MSKPKAVDEYASEGKVKLKPYSKRVEKERPDDWDKVINFYRALDKPKAPYYNPYFEWTGLKHPNRGLIVAPTGGGKTNLFNNIIKQMHCFDAVDVLCRSPDEPLYDFLREHFHGECNITSNPDELPDLEEIDDSIQGIMNFDDVLMMDKAVQRRIAEYFIAVRKKNRSAFYTTQSYFDTPKVVRLQCPYIFFLLVNSMKDFQRVCREYCTDKTPKQMFDMYTQAKKEKSFFWVNLDAPVRMRYRNGFGGVFPE